jgi:hypothetical protein
MRQPIDQVEVFLPVGEIRDTYYGGFARTHGLGMEGAANYEKIKVPYPGGHLPGFRLQADGKICTFVLRKPFGYALPLISFAFACSIPGTGPGKPTVS